jgi:cytoskeletal protein RodZ
MIELLLIVGVALLVGWQVWKRKHQPAGKPADSKPTSANTSAAESQTNTPSPAAPVTQQTEQPLAAPAPEPVVESAPAAVVASAEKPVATSPLATEAATAKIPEDSVLKRHYLAALQAEKDALNNPYPTDSVLRRHYETLHKIAIPSQAVYEPESSQPQASTQPTDNDTANIPDDSILRSKIEAELPPRPTDSVLKRHHDSLVQALLQQRLAGQ